MEGDLRGPDRSRGELTDEAIAAIRSIEALGHDPLLLGYHPIARLNPFQSLLYQRAWEAGVAPLPVVRDERIDELTELARLGFPTVLHLHWLNMIFGRASSPRDGRRARDSFLRRLDLFRAAGGRVAWTVHNILPHGTPLESDEADLRRAIVERSEVVHVMAERTVELVRPWFDIPAAKVLHVPHPAYTGAYPDVVTREEGRHQLRIASDETVFVVLGSIKPYKGLVELLDAWESLPADGRPRRLVIAGAPSGEPGVAESIARGARMTTVLVHPRQLEPHELQIFMRAADVAVLPYLRTLNSGVLMLALTFGLPVVVPLEGALTDLVDERFARTFDGDAPSSLADALLGADALLTAEARSAALAAAERHAPGPLSLRFAMGLREMLSIGDDRPTEPVRGSDLPGVAGS